MTYTSTVLTDTPFLYLHLNDSTSVAADGSGNARTGTLTGTPTYQANSLVSDNGSDAAIRFSGDDLLTVAHTALPLPGTTTFPSATTVPSSSQTLEFWFSTTSTGPSTLLSTAQFSLTLNASGHLTYTHFLTTGTAGTTYTTPLNTGTPTHVAVVYTATTGSVYVNSVLRASITYASTAAGSSNLVFGSSFVGLLDEVALYPVALSVARIQAHYSAGTKGTTATLTARTGVVVAPRLTTFAAVSLSTQTSLSARSERGAFAAVLRPTTSLTVTASVTPGLDTPPAPRPAPVRSTLSDVAVIDLTVNTSHIAVAKAEVLDEFGSVIAVLPVLGGSVSIDVDNTVRRSCSFSLVDVDGVYDAYTAPGAFEVRLSRGVEVDGFTYYAPLGVFGISEDSLPAATREVSVNASDRSRRVSRAKLTDYYVVSANTNYATAIRNLINSRVPGLSYNFTATTSLTPLLVFSPQDDPWEKAEEMAVSIGMEVFFDQEGICCLRPTPDVATAPLAASYLEGVSATFLDATRTRSDSDTFNHIIVVGASAGSTAPVLARAMDTDPLSPTYIGSPVGSSAFGDVPKWITSGYVTTLAQAQAMANAELEKVLGLTEQVSLSAVVNPTLTAGNVIAISSTSARVDARYLIESLNIPLSPDESMSGTMRQRRIST